MAKKNSSSLFKVEINHEKAKDTGLAIVLILLLLELFLGSDIYFKIAIVVLVIDMTVPQLFIPFAYIWFGFAQILGTFVSKILLFVVFFVMVLPIALLRRMLGKDSLRLKNWNTNDNTVFNTRDHLFSASDIEKPY